MLDKEKFQDEYKERPYGQQGMDPKQLVQVNIIVWKQFLWEIVRNNKQQHRSKAIFPGLYSWCRSKYL